MKQSKYVYCPECEEEKEYNESNKVSMDENICPDCGEELELSPGEERK